MACAFGSQEVTVFEGQLASQKDMLIFLVTIIKRLSPLHTQPPPAESEDDVHQNIEIMCLHLQDKITN